MSFAADLNGSPVDFHAWVARHDLTTEPVAAGRSDADAGSHGTAPHEHRGATDPAGRRPPAVRRPEQHHSRVVPQLPPRGPDHHRLGAQEVIVGSLDAEGAALVAHRRTLDPATSTPIVAAGAVDEPMPDGEPFPGDAAGRRQETGWTACTDPDEHPRTGKPCRSSFRDCFHCSNCLVTPDHLPRLPGLLAALRDRREQLDDQLWWQRYGPAWRLSGTTSWAGSPSQQIDYA